jgi:multidrug efflux system membrane fusion protein
MGGGAALSALALERDNLTPLGEGKLAVIDNQIDVTTGTIRLKATFPNDDLRLWPGQFVNARLLLTTRKDGLVVPASVVQRGPEGSYAFVIKPDQTVAVQPVKVAQIENGEALIDEGLQAGQPVVVDGQYRLQAGSKVKLGAPEQQP